MYAAKSEPRPLFPGYIFGSFPLELFSKVGNAYGVRKVVRFGATLAVVPEDVIAEISERMQRGHAAAARAKFKHGDKVLVTDGPWRNLVGVFDCESSRERVRILLDTVGFANGSGWKTEMHGNFMRLQLGRAEIMLV
jgi:transcriptional antiterminator RfaH